jgi:hypothetical protein
MTTTRAGLTPARVANPTYLLEALAEELRRGEA